MKITTILLGISAIIFLSCQSSHLPETIAETEADSNAIDLKKLIVKGSVDTTKTFVITDDCVFVIQLSSHESDSIEKSDPEGYISLSENANNNAALASELFKNLNIKSFWSDKRYVRYGNYTIDTRSRNLAGEYCIIFTKNHEPEFIPTEIINEELLGKYFNIK